MINIDLGALGHVSCPRDGQIAFIAVGHPMVTFVRGAGSRRHRAGKVNGDGQLSDRVYGGP